MPSECRYYTALRSCWKYLLAVYSFSLFLDRGWVLRRAVDDEFVEFSSGDVFHDEIYFGVGLLDL
jgi:hypothetical protein